MESTTKSEIALKTLHKGGQISVQVLNEFVSAARKKYQAEWPHIHKMLEFILVLCGNPLPLTGETHHQAVRIAERYGLHIYDASIVACALAAGCTVLYSEDMQSGQQIEGLVIENPFRDMPVEAR